MKRFLAALALLLALSLPALAMAEAAQEALYIGGSIFERDDDARIVRFEVRDAPDSDEPQSAQEDGAAATATDTDGASADVRAVAVSALLDARFEQERAAMIYEQAAVRGWHIWHREYVYRDERIASLGLIWEGRQADGTDGCSAYGLTLDLTTGEELTFDGLFTDADAAAQAMEAIVERDVMGELSDYLEFADLLPLPRDCFWFDEGGFTVGYGDGRYRYFSGRNGTIHFAWHELAAFIGEDSPLYALSRPQPADARAIEEQVTAGRFGKAMEYDPGKNTAHALREGMPYGLGDRLGDALGALTLLADPDYTRDSMVYLFEESPLRGYALEIPRYADTPEEDTPVSAVRASRVRWHGLTTGETRREEIVALLGEPERTLDYGAQDASYAMLAPGESLLYAMGENVLEAHLDEDGVLSCLILRAAFPERLY